MEQLTQATFSDSEKVQSVSRRNWRPHRQLRDYSHGNGQKDRPAERAESLSAWRKQYPTLVTHLPHTALCADWHCGCLNKACDSFLDLLAMWCGINSKMAKSFRPWIDPTARLQLCQTEISQQLLDGLSWKRPSWSPQDEDYRLRWSPDLFCSAAIRWSFVVFKWSVLLIILMDCHEIWFQH